MARSLNEIVAHIRAVAGNPSIKTTLIQTEDLEMLCDVADALGDLAIAADTAELLLQKDYPAEASSLREKVAAARAFQ